MDLRDISLLSGHLIDIEVSREGNVPSELSTALDIYQKVCTCCDKRIDCKSQIHLNLVFRGGTLL